MDNLAINEESITKLSSYSFPGNIRELENILERAATLCEDNVITESDIQLPTTANVIMDSIEEEIPNNDMETSSISLSKDQLEQYLENKEKDAIVAALEKTRWNKTAAAKILGISFRQLRYRLKKLDLE